MNIWSRFRRRARCAAAATAVVLAATVAADAGRIERVTSPGGIEIWLVREASVPVIALDFAFAGGANEDPADKPGLARMVAALLDEGAGDLDAAAFSKRLEEHAIEMTFNATRDHVRGSLRTLGANGDVAFGLLRLALGAPRFDTEAVERIRGQILAGLRRETTSPNDIAGKRWWETAFPGHPYGRPTGGTLDSVPGIAADDLKAYAGRVFARDTLKVAIVGDVDPVAAGRLVDHAFGGLPAKARLGEVAAAAPLGLGRREVIELDVPQAVVVFGGPGVPRRDPDFFAAFVLNHILGGGSFTSRLYNEVREKRGLAYSVYTALSWYDHAALFRGTTATRADRAAETLDVIDREIRRLAAEGPTEDELAKAKSYLKGSYALAFDTSTKIAGQLVQIQLDGLGVDYIDRRGGLIDAVTLADVRRVAKRLFDGGLLVTVVGRPQGVAPKGG